MLSVGENSAVEVSSNGQQRRTWEGIRERIAGIIQIISAGLYDRDDVIKLSVLAVLSGQNVFLYGPPGTGKSMISRRIASLFADSSYFEHLMHRFCTPEELFGPVSIRELKNDRYHRLTGGYLAEADFAFLDEIWKSSPAVLNTLLTLINERRYHNGSEIIRVPLKSLISASNEVPLHEAGLDALYDRFLVRLVVNPVSSQELFKQMITSRKTGKSVPMPEELAVTDEEYSSWLQAIDEIDLPDDCAEALVRMRGIIADNVDLSDLDRDDVDDDFELGGAGDEEGNYGHLSYVSDRRWFQIIKILKASAFFNGRSAVKIRDFFVLKYCLWNTSSDMESFSSLVEDTVKEFASDELFPQELQESIRKEMDREGPESTDKLLARLRVCIKAFNEITDSLRKDGVQIVSRGGEMFFNQVSESVPHYSRREPSTSVNKISFESAITEMSLDIGQQIKCRVVRASRRNLLFFGQLECMPDDGFNFNTLKNGSQIDMRIVKIDRENRLLLVKEIKPSSDYWIPVVNYDLGVNYHSIYSESFERQLDIVFNISKYDNEQMQIVITSGSQQIKKLIKIASVKLMVDLLKQHRMIISLEELLNKCFARYDSVFDQILEDIDRELFISVSDKKILKEIFFDQIPNVRKAKNDFLELMNVRQGE
jgi:MoxR-like ATPase